MRHLATATLLVGFGMIVLGSAPPASAHISSFFDIFLESVVAGPPYPTAPIAAAVGDSSPGAVPREKLSLGLQSCSDGGGGGGLLAARVEAHDSGGGIGHYGISSFFDIFLEPYIGPSSFFDIFLESAIWPGGSRGTLVARHPELPPNDLGRHIDVFRIDSFFDIFYSVDIGAGVADYHLHGSCYRIDSFFDVFTELYLDFPAESFFDIFVAMNMPAPPDPGAPAFTIEITSVYSPRTIGVQPATWSGVKALYGR